MNPNRPLTASVKREIHDGVLKKCADLERELQEAVELLRPASAPELYHNKEAEIWARRRDAFLARQKGAQS